MPKALTKLIPEPLPLSPHPVITRWVIPGLAIISNLAAVFTLDKYAKLTFLTLGALLSITLLIYILYWWTRRLRLSQRWQMLAWTHYRPLLSALCGRAEPYYHFDFLTHQGADFPNRIAPEELLEFQYASRFSKPELDLAICDIEDIALIQQSADAIRSFNMPVALEGFLPQSLINSFHAPTPLAPILNQGTSENPHTIALPLRWGFNGVAYRFRQDTLETFDAQTQEQLKRGVFDLNWLLDGNSSIYRYITASKSQCPLLIQDWHLPVLTQFARGCMANKEWSNYIKSDIDPHLIALANMSLTRSNLIRDPLRLIERSAESPEVVIIGAGNWIQSNRNNPLRPESPPLRIAAYLDINQKPQVLLWCECLVFLAPSETPLTTSWKRDALSIVKFIQSNYIYYHDAYPLHGYPTIGSVARRSESSIRNFDPEKIGVPRTRSARSVEWEMLWNEWKESLPKR